MAARRRPGRPSSRPVFPPLQHHGIVAEPNDQSNLFEFVYGHPCCFKILFAFFRNLKTDTVYLRCAPTGLTFFARDRVRQTRVVAYIRGDRVNWFYCGAVQTFMLDCKIAERIFSSVNSSIYRVSLTVKTGAPLQLLIIFKDACLDKETRATLKMSPFESDIALFAAEDELPAAARLPLAARPPIPLDGAGGSVNDEKLIAILTRHAPSVAEAPPSAAAQPMSLSHLLGEGPPAMDAPAPPPLGDILPGGAGDPAATISAEDRLRYPIEFRIDANKFKKTMTDVARYGAELLTIEKLGATPLRFHCIQVGRFDYLEVYHAPGKINLRSEISVSESFRCTVDVGTMKQLSGSVTSESIILYCRAPNTVLVRSIFKDPDVDCTMSVYALVDPPPS